MKRDLDLVRNILLEVEKSSNGLDGADLKEFEHDLQRVALHVELMHDRGLIYSHITYDMARYPVLIEVTGLTWEGYDFLDTIRSPKVWNKAKTAIHDAVGETSLSVAKEICATVATSLIKANLNM